MNSNGMRKGLRAMVVATALLGAASAAGAATLASGPLRITDQSDYSCSAVNTGTKDVQVVVNVTVDGGGYGATQTCAPLAGSSVCTALNTAGSTNNRYCTITTSNKRVTRGVFCNTTSGICVPVE